MQSEEERIVRISNDILFTAVIHNDIEAIRNELTHGRANINHVNDYGDTSLLRAVGIRNITSVQMLLEHGADLFCVNRNNNNVLHQITVFGDGADDTNLQILDVLLLHGAGPNLCMHNHNGNTPSDICWPPRSVNMLHQLHWEKTRLKNTWTKELEFVIPVGVVVNIIVNYLL